jgi:hypothetical protein
MGTVNIAGNCRQFPPNMCVSSRACEHQDNLLCRWLGEDAAQYRKGKECFDEKQAEEQLIASPSLMHLIASPASPVRRLTGRRQALERSEARSSRIGDTLARVASASYISLYTALPLYTAFPYIPLLFQSLNPHATLLSLIDPLEYVPNQWTLRAEIKPRRTRSLKTEFNSVRNIIHLSFPSLTGDRGPAIEP